MLNHPLIQKVEQQQLNKELPDFQSGDTVVVQVRVREGERERIQSFEGLVIAIRNRGLNSSFTVRKLSHGVGVERTFQTHSKIISKVVVQRRGKVRKAKLYYMRSLTGKAARIQERLEKSNKPSKSGKAGASGKAGKTDEITGVDKSADTVNKESNKESSKVESPPIVASAEKAPAVKSVNPEQAATSDEAAK